MADQQVVTIRGSNLGTSILEEAVIEGFKGSLQEPLFRPGEASYEDTRKIGNGMIDRRPALIACCRGVADVINSVNFARKHELWSRYADTGGSIYAGYAGQFRFVGGAHR
jgi:hypothetical protein